MTSSNKTHQSGHLSPSPFTTNPVQSNEAYFAALAPAFRVVFVTAMMLFSKFWTAMEDSLRYNCDHNTRKFKIAALAIVLFMTALPGSREEKTEFFHRIFEKLYAKRNARMIELREAYIIWRQRKCWMWGGGFRCPALAHMPNVYVGVFAGAEDQSSFDALIPN